jgi:hypothetical protein
MKEMKGRVLAPSSIKAEGGKYRDLPGSPVRHNPGPIILRLRLTLCNYQGHTDNVEAIQDPRTIVETYRHSLLLAKRAGFDGTELLAQG